LIFVGKLLLQKLLKCNPNILLLEDNEKYVAALNEMNVVKYGD